MEQVAAHRTFRYAPSSCSLPLALHRTAAEAVMTGGRYSYTRMLLPYTISALPRLSVTVTRGACTPLPPSGPTVPEVPLRASPANRN